MSEKPAGCKFTTAINAAKIHRDLTVPQLIEEALSRGEGILTDTGALSVNTGKYTGRSPEDRFIVDEPCIHDEINWGEINKPIESAKFESLYQKLAAYFKDRELFIFDGYAGADKEFRLPVRIINEYASQNFFVHQLLIRPLGDELQNFIPGFTIICAPGFKAEPEIDGTYSEAFIIISFEKKTVIIGGTGYAGEIKKAVFSVMNYLLPKRNVLPMHCSANVGVNGDTALFFGLSGTGKTTLSTNPERKLIGDDEHGWSERGIFNIEGGCYAKCINLSKEREPQIWNAIKFGSLVENVVCSKDRIPDYSDASLTENTRAGYPVNYIPGAELSGVGNHPKTIIFLTADAFGVLPPISKLTRDQAMYHFMSGYTSKLAGTEQGIITPTATFSACFGSPFMPYHPAVYTKLLGDRIDRYNADVFLINTGWSGGPYEIGKRINLSYTRAMVSAAISGILQYSKYSPDPVFKIQVPENCPGVPENILHPRKTWKDTASYDNTARMLSGLFIQNFKRFKDYQSLWPVLL